MGKRNKPRLLTEDIYNIIEKRTTLTKSQVAECFEEYANIIKLICYSDNREPNMTIPLPKLGTFHFKERQGRKKGKYKINCDFKNKTRKEQEYIVEEDKPSYERINFEIYKVIQKKVRETSIKRNKKAEFNLDFLKKEQDYD